jgi:hypothetical protein
MSIKNSNRKDAAIKSRMTAHAIRILISAVVLFASACASTHMKQFIGKDARYIAVQDGPPAYVFDLPDGTRAFQYYWGGGTYQLPKTTTTNGQVQLVGNAAYYSEQQLETGGGIVSSAGCLVTYIAKWNPDAKGWIVRQISYPHRLVC